MTEAERAKLREQIGMAVIGIQNQNRDRFSPDILMPEIVVTLVSLAGFFARQSGAMECEQFAELCEEVMDDEWKMLGYDLGASPG